MLQMGPHSPFQCCSPVQDTPAVLLTHTKRHHKDDKDKPQHADTPNKQRGQRALPALSSFIHDRPMLVIPGQCQLCAKQGRAEVLADLWWMGLALCSPS